MKNPICISTGCVCELYKDRNDRIDALRQFSPLGIEISFSHPEYLFDFEISKNNLKYLQSLKFNSIHAPWMYKKVKERKEALEKIRILYKQINARNVVFHKDGIEDYDLVASSGFVVSLENDDWKKPNNSLEYFKCLLDKNKKFRFTFDFAHAVSTESDIAEYINYFKDILVEIHFSIIIKDSLGQYSSHTFLHQNDGEELRKLLQPLKKVSVPLVLESFVSNLNDINLIKKEIEYIKKI